MKTSFTLLLTAICIFSFAQNKDDKKIIVTLADTTGIYEVAKAALTKNDFEIKDLGSRDALLTHPRESSGIPGFSVINIEIDGNRLIINGYYTLKKTKPTETSGPLKNFIPIRYYGGSKTWRTLELVAQSIEGGQITYAE